VSILQSLIWTCDECKHSEIIYKEINPDEKLTLATPGKMSWMLIQPDNGDPKKLLCENCAKELLGEENGEIMEDDLKGQSWAI